ncbi:MAG: APC family permease [Clostridia bacterium]|nr:APC family permease [Clostridia bacterium]
MSGQKLKRVLGFWPAYGAAVGLVVSGTAMVAVGNVAGSAGKAAFITALIGLIPMMAAAFAYGELTAMLPGGGMVSDYTMPALGRFWSVFAILSGYIMLIAADGGTQQVIGGLSMESLTGIPQPIVSAALLIVVVMVNLFGVEFYGKAEAILTIFMMVTFGILGIMGLAGLGESAGATVINADVPMISEEAGWAPVFSSVGIAIWWFIGFEFACPMAEENKKPYKNIPYALIIGLISIYIMDVIFSTAASKYTPTDILINSAIPHVEAAGHMLGSTGFLVMTILTIVAAFTTANAEMAALPRMLYGMARENLVPSFFGKIHPKYRTPWNGIIFTALLMAATIIYITANGADVGTVLSLIMIACICWMVSYAIAMIDVLILRKKYPDYPRLWKAPAAAITMPIGIIGVVYAIYTLTDYLVPALIAMVLFAAYTGIWLKTKKMKMFEKTPIQNIAKDILERSEELPEWDEAVTEWLQAKNNA